MQLLFKKGQVISKYLNYKKNFPLVKKKTKKEKKVNKEQMWQMGNKW